MHQAALNLTPSAKTVQHRSNIICRGEAAGVCGIKASSGENADNRGEGERTHPASVRRGFDAHASAVAGRRCLQHSY